MTIRIETSDLRCPTCGRLLAKRTASGGGVEVRHHGARAIVRIWSGEVECVRCAVAVSVRRAEAARDPKGPPSRKGGS